MELELRWQDRETGPMQTPRKFLDFVVDGESLRERHGLDNVTPLGWLLPESDDRAARRLLGDDAGDVDGRVAIYVCAECGEVECGAVTALVERDADTGEVVWRDFAHTLREDDGWRHDPLAWGEFRFKAESYRGAILSRPKG